MAVGYATLYGDMAGGHNVLELSNKTTCSSSPAAQCASAEGAMGRKGKVIPAASFQSRPRPSSARQKARIRAPLSGARRHLRPDRAAISSAGARGEGYDIATVNRVGACSKREYKRRSSARVKITSPPDQQERRYPIANGFAADSS